MNLDWQRWEFTLSPLSSGQASCSTEKSYLALGKLQQSLASSFLQNELWHLFHMRDKTECK
jgi:hypothetical protein